MGDAGLMVSRSLVRGEYVDAMDFYGYHNAGKFPTTPKLTLISSRKVDLFLGGEVGSAVGPRSSRNTSLKVQPQHSKPHHVDAHELFGRT